MKRAQRKDARGQSRQGQRDRRRAMKEVVEARMAAKCRESASADPWAKPSPAPHSRPFASIRGWPAQSHLLVLAGVGNIGSQFVDHAARLAGVKRVLVVDRDRYDATNLLSQAITLRDVGRPKAEVQARRLRQLNPELHVEAFAADLESLPLGWLRGAVVIGCLDSVHARLRLGEMAWRVGAPFLDGGVNPEAGLARVTCYLPGPDRPCCACGLSDEDYQAMGSVHPCTGDPQTLPMNRTADIPVGDVPAGKPAVPGSWPLSRSKRNRTLPMNRTFLVERGSRRASPHSTSTRLGGSLAQPGSPPSGTVAGATEPPTGGTFSLGGLAATWLALECERILRDGPLAILAGREVLLETGVGRLLVSRRRPNPACRFDHRTWTIEPFGGVTLASSLAEALESAGRILGPSKGVILSLPGQRLVKALFCPGCGAIVERFHVVGRGGPRECPQCRERALAVVGFKIVDRVDQHLPRVLLRQSLRRVGIRGGDVLAAEVGERTRYLEIPCDGA